MEACHNIPNLTLEQSRIYRAYRLTLKGIPHTADSRAGNRKQKALHLVAERYKLPVSVVKKLIRTKDLENGITHEHDVNYLKEFRFREKANEFLAKQGENKACPSCGKIPTEKGDEVRIREDPYEYEIYEKLQPMLSCYKCYLLVAEEI